MVDAFVSQASLERTAQLLTTPHDVQMTATDVVPATVDVVFASQDGVVPPVLTLFLARLDARVMDNVFMAIASVRRHGVERTARNC